jgi:enoyl-CoA hydratase/carnithine racemase
MGFINLSVDEDIAIVTINRPKVNALNEPLVEELYECLQKLADKPNAQVKVIILTGEGSFFSFGLDVPEFLNYSKEPFTRFLAKFTELISYLFLYPKPVIAALNGHTIAGGCMLAIACDYRLMVSDKAKISLNEITFGSTVFASAISVLKHLVGGRNAELILYSGRMYSAEEAQGLRLIDEVVSKENLDAAARRVARDFVSKNSDTFQSIKMLLRRPMAEEINKREINSILEFTEIWYSESTRENLEKIKIRD